MLAAIWTKVKKLWWVVLLVSFFGLEEYRSYDQGKGFPLVNLVAAAADKAGDILQGNFQLPHVAPRSAPASTSSADPALTGMRSIADKDNVCLKQCSGKASGTVFEVSCPTGSKPPCKCKC